MTLSEITKSITMHAASFQQVKLSRETFLSWHMYFSNCAFDDFNRALRAACTEAGREFFPTPGAVMKYLQHEKISGTEALEKLMYFAQRSAAENTLSDFFGAGSAVMSAVRAIGWNQFRYANIEHELPFVQKRFLELFDEVSEKHAVQKQLSGPLNGAEKTLLADLKLQPKLVEMRKVAK